MAVVLNKNLRKNLPARFGQLAQEETIAVTVLPDKLISSQGLPLPCHSGKRTSDTDARNVQVGCVLLQVRKDGTDRPIEYWSHYLNDAQHAYDTTHRDYYAVLWTVLMLRPYLEGTKFTIRTDHDSLR